MPIIHRQEIFCHFSERHQDSFDTYWKPWVLDEYLTRLLNHEIDNRKPDGAFSFRNQLSPLTAVSPSPCSKGLSTLVKTWSKWLIFAASMPRNIGDELKSHLPHNGALANTVVKPAKAPQADVRTPKSRSGRLSRHFVGHTNIKRPDVVWTGM